MSYRAGRSLRVGTYAAETETRERFGAAHVFFERRTPRVVALARHHPSSARGVDPIALITRLADSETRHSNTLSRFFAAVDRELHAVMKAIDDPEEEFAVGWSWGGHAVAVEQIGDAMWFVASGNARLYRLRDGRARTIFGGQTLMATNPHLFASPTNAPGAFENVVVAILGKGAPDGAAHWHGPERLDARAGDRFLLTTFGTVEGLTTEDLQATLPHGAPREAARALVERGREAAARADRRWPWGEAMVVEVVG